MKPKQEDPKEMVGGCCVCSDENGWTENPLVYCDGQGCNVAVHQACYGIVTVPTGAWFCRKCESQERAARVHSGGRRIFSQRCELCPSKDGALKRTDSGGWAHVVCALYIPEVRFGNVTTMEPIMLQLIPQERFNKSCYICEESGKESRATIGACMQCNKAGCKQHFHVTCAQSMGLLCEEAGNYLDNVKYCGYCQYHFSKLISESHPHPSNTASDESPNQISSPHQSLSQAHIPLPADADKDKDKQQERNRKLRRNGPRTPSGNSNFGDTESNVSNDEAQSSDLVLNICEEKNLSAEKESNKVPSKPLDSSDDGGSLNVQFTPNMSTLTSKAVADPFTPTMADFATNEPAKRGRSSSQERGRRAKRGMGKRGRPGSGRDTGGRDSGASSPDSFTSESAPAPKRGRKKADSKEQVASVITNGVGANTLLLGNQLNPASAVAQKMTDTLHAELEAHSIYKDEEKISNSLVGPSLPGKKENSNGNSATGSSQPPPFPQSLEQLLERQWEQGSQFLMEQAQHFDIASLLSCLHQLRQENVRLEETVSSLISRRDHLLAVNARLSVPLSSPTPANTSSPGGPNPPPSSISASSSSSSSSSVPTHTTCIPSHAVNPRPSSRGSAPAPPPPRPHSQGHHPTAGSSHTGGPASGGSGGGGHRGASPHDRRGPSPHERRGTSPHDRRAPPPPVPVENGLAEPEYRYRSPGTEHRQQSPMLPPGAQPSPTSLRHSPAGGNYHPSVSPHGVGSPSPSGVPHGHPPTPHGPPPPPSHPPPPPHPPPHPPSHPPSHPPPPPPPPHSMAPSHGPSSHGPSGQGPPSHGPPGHGSPHGPPPHGPPHGPPPMVSVTHSVAINRQSEHRGDMVRLHTGPPPPQHSSPNIGPGGYSVYQMVSPTVPGPHHSPVPPMNQPHPPPHAQVMRRDLVESGRGAPGPLEKR